MNITWPVRLVTALVWMLAAASGVYWVLRMSESTIKAPFVPTMTPGLAADDSSQQTQLARLLGVSGVARVAPAPAASARFALTGVISSVSGQGAALISVDGQPARPFLVGMQIVSGYMLKAVGLRDATLADDLQTLVSITLPPPVTRQMPATDSVARTAVPNPRLDPVTSPTGSLPPAALAGAPMPNVIIVPPGANPTLGQTGPPPRADVRRQALPPSR